MIDARREGVGSRIRQPLAIRVEETNQQPVVLLDLFRGGRGVDAENTVVIGTVCQQDLFDEKLGGLLRLPGNGTRKRALGIRQGAAGRHLQQRRHPRRQASATMQQLGKLAGGAREGNRQRNAFAAGRSRIGTHAGRRFTSASPY